MKDNLEIFTKVNINENSKANYEFTRKKKILSILENWDIVDSKIKLLEFFGNENYINEKLLYVARDPDYKKKFFNAKKEELRISLLRSLEIPRNYKKQEVVSKKESSKLTRKFSNYALQNKSAMINEKKSKKWNDNLETLDELKSVVKLISMKKPKEVLNKIPHLYIKRNQINKNELKSNVIPSKKQENYQLNSLTDKKGSLMSRCFSAKPNSLKKSMLCKEKEIFDHEIKISPIGKITNLNVEQDTSFFKENFSKILEKLNKIDLSRESIEIRKHRGLKSTDLTENKLFHLIKKESNIKSMDYDNVKPGLIKRLANNKNLFKSRMACSVNSYFRKVNDDEKTLKR